MQRRRKRSKRIGIRSLGSLYGRMRFKFRVVVVVVESCKKSGLLNHARCKFWHRVQRCTKLDKRIKWQQCHTAHAARERKKERERDKMSGSQRALATVELVEDLHPMPHNPVCGRPGPVNWLRLFIRFCQNNNNNNNISSASRSNQLAINNKSICH